MSHVRVDPAVLPERGAPPGSELVSVIGHNNSPDRFLPEVQGLRAVAVLLVVLYHADVPLLGGGYVGVDAFFVISGFVISRLLLNELSDANQLDLPRFFKRRIRRLLTPLALVVCFVLLAGVLLSPVGSQQMTIRTGIAAILLNANTYLASLPGATYFGDTAGSNPLLHTWSLSMEEQFYLVYPITLLLAWKLGRRLDLNPVRFVGGFVGIVVAVSFAAAYLSTGTAFYFTPLRAWEFGIGCLVALTPLRLWMAPARWGWLLGVLGLLLLLGPAVFYDDLTVFPGAAATPPVIGTAMLITAGRSAPKFLNWRPMQFIGDISYSWYLWHWPLLVFAEGLWPTVPTTRLYAAAFSLLPAMGSWRLVEQPIRLGVRARSTAWLATGCVGLSLLAALVAEAGFERVDEQLAAGDEPFEPHEYAQRGCNTTEPVGDWSFADCLWPSGYGSQGFAVLVGDSNAGQLSEGFVTAANDLGLDALVVTDHGCPFAEMVVTNGGVVQEECRNFVDGSVEYLVANQPELVVIASASDVYLRSDDFRFQSPHGARVETTLEGKAAVYEQGLRSVVGSLQASGSAVVVVHPVPKLDPRWDPEAMSAIRLLGTPSAMNSTVDRARSLDYREPALTIEQRVVDALGVEAVDVFDEICPSEVCAAYDGTTWRYRDWFHISIAESERLAPVLEHDLASALRRPAMR